MRIEYCKTCGTQKGRKYGEGGSTKMICTQCNSAQDEIQEDTTSMEEKLEALDELSLCCGADTRGDYKMCSACGEHC